MYQFSFGRISNFQGNIDTLAKYLGTALQVAAFVGHQDITELLLKYNANVNIQGGEYKTALSAAVSQGHHNIIKLLEDYGANIDNQGEYYTEIVEIEQEAREKQENMAAEAYGQTEKEQEVEKMKREEKSDNKDRGKEREKDTEQARMKGLQSGATLVQFRYTATLLIVFMLITLIVFHFTMSTFILLL
ncbi:hypothetical protein C8R42DRAFT_586963 [Lentinula raphanica]|nr:hypothetical protein C8R42DRAFT_586963 [Lentinula raphanica]